LFFQDFGRVFLVGEGNFEVGFFGCFFIAISMLLVLNLFRIREEEFNWWVAVIGNLDKENDNKLEMDTKW
jgi:hypothetical protein